MAQPSRSPWTILLATILFAHLVHAEVRVSDFESESLQAPWGTSTAFGAHPDTIRVGDGRCRFLKQSTEPGLSASLSMRAKAKDYPVALPWSVEYTVPDTSAFTEGGARLLNRLWLGGEPAYDWLYIGRLGGMIRVGTADGRLLYEYPVDGTSRIRFRIDASVAGIDVYATSGTGSFGQPTRVDWSIDVSEGDPVGLEIMASDIGSASAGKPYSLAISNLVLTTDHDTRTSSADLRATEQTTPRRYPRAMATSSENHLGNASFELGEDAWRSLGTTTGMGGDLIGLHGSIVDDVSWHGDHSLRVDLGPSVSPITRFDVWPPVKQVQHAPLAANIGWIEVEKGSDVTFSAYLRGSRDGLTARLRLRFSGNALDPVSEVERVVKLSTAWKRYTFTHEAMESDVCVALGLDMTDIPAELASCWIDGVQLESRGEASPYQSGDPVALGLETDGPGNVYDVAEPVVLRATVLNEGEDAADITVHVAIQDFFDQELPAQSFELSVPGGERKVIPLELELPGKGHYRASITCRAGDLVRERMIPIVVISPYTEKDSPFGLNHPSTTVEEMAILSKAGVRWVRNWSLNWDWVEPARGQRDWTAVDDQVEYMGEAGMNTLLVFPNPSTNWSTTAPDTVEDRMWYRIAYAPQEPRLLYGFIGSSTDRYKEQVRYWEFLNEPLWVPNFCLPQSAGYTVEDYVALLQGAYTAIKEADPQAQVIGGLAIEPKFTLGDDFITAGGLAYCDILNLHPYGGFTAPEEFARDMKRMLDVIDAHGGRKPIWATEAAYYAVDDKPWKPWTVPPNHFSASLLLASEKMAAEYIVRQAVVLFAHEVEKVFYHQPLNGPVNVGAWDIESTFLNPGATPNKAYVAISALANILGPRPQFVTEAGLPPGVRSESQYAYTFQSGENAVVVAWDAGASSSPTVFTPGPGVRVFDMVGNIVIGRCELSTSPLYVVSSDLNAQELATRWYGESLQ